MRRYLSLFVLVLISSVLYAFDSPAPGGRIISSFAQEFYGRFNTGHEIQSPHVYASEDGEIVFYGNRMIAVRHSDKLMTIYTNVDAIESAMRGNLVRRGQMIGNSIGGTFHFDIFDTEMNRYINPSLMIDRVKKSELPKILGMEYNSITGALELKLDNRGMNSLYSVQVDLDGKQIHDLRFETMSVSDGQLKLDGTGLRKEELYKKGGALSFVGIPFKAGNNSVEIKVKDFYGKTITFSGIIKI